MSAISTLNYPTIPSVPQDGANRIRKPLRKQAPRFAVALTREQLIDTTSQILLTYLAKNQEVDFSSASETSTSFHAKKQPKISVPDYVKRIAENTNCSDACFIVAIIYLDRIAQNDERLALDSLNIHRLVMMSLVLAAKYIDEKTYQNKWYAQVGGMKLEEFNSLESELLFEILNYDLYVEEAAFTQMNEYVKQYSMKSSEASVDSR